MESIIGTVLQSLQHPVPYWAWWLLVIFIVLDRAVTAYWPIIREVRKERDHEETQRERERNQRSQARRLVDEQEKWRREVL